MSGREAERSRAGNKGKSIYNVGRELIRRRLDACVSANKSIRLCQSSSKDLWQKKFLLMYSIHLKRIKKIVYAEDRKWRKKTFFDLRKANENLIENFPCYIELKSSTSRLYLHKGCFDEAPKYFSDIYEQWSALISNIFHS